MATVSRSENDLYFGDNLAILREHIDDESIDLVYLDPPFNSNATYNILFRSPRGQESHAQITAFEDTWHWGEQARLEFEDLVHQANTDVAEQIQALKKFLGENDMMAYLTMMGSRLLELHRVLKPTGSLYLHCDSNASHYLKIVLDAIFGVQNYRNEIIWKRTTAKSLMTRRLPVNHDVLLYYSKTDQATWNDAALYTRYDLNNLEPKTASKYCHSDPDGRLYQLDNLINPNPNRPNLTYEFLGVTRVWRWTKQRMQAAYEAGLVVQSKPGAVPRLKRYLDEQRGRALDDVWTDIFPLNSQAQERLGYPTQKPLALLERIVKLSSNEGDVVLDPFCGCGTAIHAAQKLKRRWIGIDITNLAIAIVESRLRKHFPDITFQVHGTPKDLDGARALAEADPYEFQYWACGLVDAQPYQHKKKGADRGIDGVKYFVDDANETCKIVVSVKGGQNISSQAIRDLRGVIDREKAKVGLFITLKEPTAAMEREAIEAGFYNTSTERFPRIQVLTIDGLLSGTERARHPGASVGRQKLMQPRRGRKPDEERRQRELFADTAGRVAGEVHKLSETAARKPKRVTVEAPSAEEDAAALRAARHEAAVARAARGTPKTRKVGRR